jgi:hypothetical protein
VRTRILLAAATLAFASSPAVALDCMRGLPTYTSQVDAHRTHPYRLSFIKRAKEGDPNVLLVSDELPRPLLFYRSFSNGSGQESFLPAETNAISVDAVPIWLNTGSDYWRGKGAAPVLLLPNLTARIYDATEGKALGPVPAAWHLTGCSSGE